MKKLFDELRRIASFTAWQLGHYLPQIEQRFAPSREVHSELEDCKEALEEVLEKIRAARSAPARPRTTENVRRFMDHLAARPLQHKLVESLATVFPASRSDNFFKSLFVIDSRQLGRLLTGITKNALKFGVANVITKQRAIKVDNLDGSKYLYTISVEVAEAAGKGQA